MPEASKGVNLSKLWKGLDLHSTWQWEHFLTYGIDAYFLARKVDLTHIESLGKPADYWKQVGYTDGPPPIFEGEFKLPRDLSRVAIYSIKAFEYPHVMALFRLPDIQLLGNETAACLYWGVENGALFFNALYCWRLITTNVPGFMNRLQAQIGPLNYDLTIDLDINKPANFLTGDNIYQIMVGKNLVTFKINLNPVLFVIPCGRGAVVKQNVLPYSILLIPSTTKTITPFLEWWTDTRTMPASGDLTSTISPYRYRFSDGPEVNQLNLPLYVEDTATLFQGSVVAAGSLTSHPFPTMGFTSKTVKIRASQNGTLSLQEYLRTNTWVEYDTMNTVANTLETMDIVNEHILTRAVFTPGAYPCTVTHGEVDLS